MNVMQIINKTENLFGFNVRLLVLKTFEFLIVAFLKTRNVMKQNYSTETLKKCSKIFIKSCKNCLKWQKTDNNFKFLLVFFNQMIFLYLVLSASEYQSIFCIITMSRLLCDPGRFLGWSRKSQGNLYRRRSLPSGKPAATWQKTQFLFLSLLWSVRIHASELLLGFLGEKKTKWTKQDLSSEQQTRKTIEIWHILEQNVDKMSK